MNSKIIFFGTDEFAVIVLNDLIENGFDVVAVVTTPDKEAGRDKVLTPSAVKIIALEKNITLIQPIKYTPEIIETIRNIGAEVGVLAVYGKILPETVLNIFPKGIINIHPSLLPIYRGPSPIKTAILNGDQETGITIIKLDQQMDHGPMLGQSKTQISPDEKLTELRDRLASLSGTLLTKILPDYLADKLDLITQDESKVTLTRLFKKEDGQVNWQKTPQEIYNQFRAFYDWPGIWTTYQGKVFKILDCKIENNQLKIIKIQLEGGKPMTLEEFKRGHKDFKETDLGV